MVKPLRWLSWHVVKFPVESVDGLAVTISFCVLALGSGPVIRTSCRVTELERVILGVKNV